MLRLLRLFVPLTLALSVCASAFASCLPESPAETQMACCRTDGHCDPAMKPMDCCSSTASTHITFVATKPSTLHKPAILKVIGAAVTLFIGPPIAVGPIRTFHAGVDSSPPIFLRVSSLRI